MATMPCLAKIPVPYADKLLQDLEEAGVALKEHHSLCWETDTHYVESALRKLPCFQRPTARLSITVVVGIAVRRRRRHFGTAASDGARARLGQCSFASNGPNFSRYNSRARGRIASRLSPQRRNFKSGESDERSNEQVLSGFNIYPFTFYLSTYMHFYAPNYMRWLKINFIALFGPSTSKSIKSHYSY